jgi:PhnB protein
MSAAPNDMPTAVQYAPTRGGVVPYLSVNGATKAAEFYTRAFGAQEVARYPLDEKGRTCHLHLYINGSSVMLSDPFPEYGHGLERPQAFNLTIQVEDIDSWWQRAVEAGATIVMPVERMFWGDRYGQLRDPFGVLWSINEPAK